MSTPDCLFCKIAGRQMEGNLVFEDDRVVAFRDINPQAPVHILVIPRKHIPSISQLAKEDETLVGYMLSVVKELANREGLEKNGFRTVLNTGGYAGQTVQHLHMHLMGGRAFRWPPG